MDGRQFRRRNSPMHLLLKQKQAVHTSHFLKVYAAEKKEEVFQQTQSLQASTPPKPPSLQASKPPSLQGPRRDARRVNSPQEKAGGRGDLEVAALKKKQGGVARH